MTYPVDDVAVRRILGESRVVAVVGLSAREDRPSHDVARYLQRVGYRIVPVNPNETEVLGERAYPSLLDIPADVRIDLVDVFRRSEDTPEVARQAVAIGARALWLQLGIENEEARRIAEDAGLAVVMDRCTKVDHRRLQEGTP